MQLDSLYGYNKVGGANILYDDAVNHIAKLFFKIDKIDKNLFYEKIINIAINGKWDGDAINYFQRGLKASVLSNLSLTLDILKKNNDEDVRSFWYFYFDGPHPAEQISLDLEKMKLLDVKVYQLMKEAYQQVLDDNKHH